MYTLLYYESKRFTYTSKQVVCITQNRKNITIKWQQQMSTGNRRVRVSDDFCAHSYVWLMIYDELPIVQTTTVIGILNKHCTWQTRCSINNVIIIIISIIIKVIKELKKRNIFQDMGGYWKHWKCTTNDNKFEQPIIIK